MMQIITIKVNHLPEEQLSNFFIFINCLFALLVANVMILNGH